MVVLAIVVAISALLLIQNVHILRTYNVSIISGEDNMPGVSLYTSDKWSVTDGIHYYSPNLNNIKNTYGEKAFEDGIKKAMNLSHSMIGLEGSNCAGTTGIIINIYKIDGQTYTSTSGTVTVDGRQYNISSGYASIPVSKGIHHISAAKNGYLDTGLRTLTMNCSAIIDITFIPYGGGYGGGVGGVTPYLYLLLPLAGVGVAIFVFRKKLF